ncbi:MAG: GIY-YIG nuclease family protein, partial [Patescibacteria group bacterium]
MVAKNQVVGAPHTPGVYFFKNDTGNIIYIGKARNLKMRLYSYFRKDESDARKCAMLKEAADVSWRELSSDIEALIQEAALIKKHHPKYNVSMRDDKQYFYVAFTKEKFPKIFITHQPKSGQSRTLSKKKSDFVRLGPFTDGWAVRTALKTLRRTYPYCQCALKREIRHSRPCQQASIGRCLGVCCLKEKEWPNFYPDASMRVKTYKENAKIIKKIFSGKYLAVISLAKKQMELASARKNYEQAAKFRDELKALEIV